MSVARTDTLYSIEEIDLYTPNESNKQLLYSSFKYYFKKHQKDIEECLKNTATIPDYTEDAIKSLKKMNVKFLNQTRLQIINYPIQVV